MKKVIILGASGSVGRQAIEVIKEHPADFQLVGFSVYNNIDFATKLLEEFSSVECIYLNPKHKDKIDFKNIANSINKLIDSNKDAIILNAIGGTDGIYPSLYAIKNNRTLALANKETIVCAGEILTDYAKKYFNSSIIPVDSEHSAIFQCLMGENIDDVDELLITCSGGPFRDYSIKQLENVTVNDCLKHPNWNMGDKITINCATLFNKGLEVIEAHYLFGLDYSKIKVLMHRQSIVHSLVSFKDGNTKALLSNPSMKLPILYALNQTQRDIEINNKLDLSKIGNLSFEEIDSNKFKAIDLAYKVGKIGGSAPLTYCVANETCVDYFIDQKINYNDIGNIVNHIIDNTNYCPSHQPLGSI